MQSQLDEMRFKHNEIDFDENMKTIKTYQNISGTF